MNALNFALQASQYLDSSVDITKLDAVHALGLCNAMSRALSDYWARAPRWVTLPELQTPQQFTVETDTNVLMLPAGFEKVLGAVWISGGTTAADWSELPEGYWTPDRAAATSSGKPANYTVSSYLPDSAGADTNPTTGETFMRNDRVPALFFDCIPQAAYLIRMRYSVEAPRVLPHHLSGRATTVGIPVPDNHMVSVVVPMCARYLKAHPKARQDLAAIAADEYQAALQAMANIPATQSGASRSIGTPLGF